MSFVRGPNPIWFYSNLVGQPVDDTYYAFFLENTLPYNPQAVFMDPNGTNPWPNPIEFQPSSGLPNNLYFDPDKVYRIEIRQGDNQSASLIYLIQNYTIAGEGTADVVTLDSTENMITNPQFADTYFVSPIIINTAGTHSIAPGWDLVTSGTGSTTITQVATVPNNHIPGNPPYYLDFDSSGWGSVFLRQRFTNNGALFGGGAIAISFTAMSVASAEDLIVNYQPSDGGAAQNIFPLQSITVGTFLEYKNAVNLDPSTNSDTAPIAYVDILFTLPASGEISLTNIQITGQSAPLDNPATFVAPSFQQQTYERTVDHEFHVYRDAMLRQPKDNLVVGWTFALNPWQFALRALTTVPANQYTADQTILIQQNYVANNVGSNVQVGQASIADGYGLEIKAVTATNQFAIIQYIDPSNIRPYWGDILSSMVNAKFKTSAANPSPRFKMRLIYRTTTLPPTISRTEPIATWVSGQDPAFAAGWTSIVPLNDPTYTLSTLPQNFPFDKFILPNVSDLNQTLGVVIYSIDNIVSTGIPDSIIFNKVSLVPNDFALEANVENYQDTLRKCQYYFEQSYDQYYPVKTGVTVGLRHSVNPLIIETIGVDLYKNTFSLLFDSVKRIAPTVNTNLIFYSIAGTAQTVTMAINIGPTYPAPLSGSNPTDVAVSEWTVISSTINQVALLPSNTTQIMRVAPSGLSSQGVLFYNYTIDLRLGL